MQCKCGATATLRESVRSKERAVFKFHECQRCGRAEPDVLLIDGRIDARGQTARERYAAMTDGPIQSKKPTAPRTRKNSRKPRHH